MAITIPVPVADQPGVGRAALDVGSPGIPLPKLDPQKVIDYQTAETLRKTNRLPH